jgi:hypothetical protein
MARGGSGAASAANFAASAHAVGGEGTPRQHIPGDFNRQVSENGRYVLDHVSDVSGLVAAQSFVQSHRDAIRLCTTLQQLESYFDNFSFSGSPFRHVFTAMVQQLQVVKFAEDESSFQTLIWSETALKSCTNAVRQPLSEADFCDMVFETLLNSFERRMSIINIGNVVRNSFGRPIKTLLREDVQQRFVFDYDRRRIAVVMVNAKRLRNPIQNANVRPFPQFADAAHSFLVEHGYVSIERQFILANLFNPLVKPNCRDAKPADRTFHLADVLSAYPERFRINDGRLTVFAIQTDECVSRPA